MAVQINDHEFKCYAIDGDTAVIALKNQNFVMDYSTLMDLLTNLAAVASQVENSFECEEIKEFH